MNERSDPNDPRFSSADTRNRATDPVTGAPVSDALAANSAARDSSMAPAPVKSRGTWPILIVLLAAVVIAMLVWMPGGQDASDTATEPAATSDTTTPATPDVATPPATTGTATPPAAETTTPPASTDTAPTAVTPDAPATQTPSAPATGTAP